MPIEGIIVYTHEDGEPKLTQDQVEAAKRRMAGEIASRGGELLDDSERTFDATVIDGDGIERKIGGLMAFADFPEGRSSNDIPVVELGEPKTPFERSLHELEASGP